MDVEAKIPWPLMLDLVIVLRKINKDHLMHGTDEEWAAWKRVEAVFLEKLP